MAVREGSTNNSTGGILAALHTNELKAKATLSQTCTKKTQVERQQTILAQSMEQTKNWIENPDAKMTRNHLFFQTQVGQGVSDCKKQSTWINGQVNKESRQVHILAQQRNVLLMRCQEAERAQDKKADTAATEDFNTYNIPTFGGGDGLT